MAQLAIALACAALAFSYAAARLPTTPVTRIAQVLALPFACLALMVKHRAAVAS
jgi:hypothetical protein